MTSTDLHRGSRPSASDSSIAVVVPVRDAKTLLHDCLSSILAQLQEHDELIVVDDGSSDGSGTYAANRGATVLRANGGGPYAARNHGWRHVQQEIVVFTDVRCRARPGWLETIRTSMRDTSVALACSDVQVLDGESRAAKVMFHRQTFLTRHTNGDRFFLPFFPTCNLAVRRTALDAVGGFAEVRSGGDADLCWRIQLAGAGTLASVNRTTMDWVPRHRTRALLRQWARYGQSQAHLRWRYRSQGLETAAPSMARRVDEALRVVAVDVIRRRAPADVALLDGLATWVHNTHLARELRSIAKARSVSERRQPA